jgi:hypothetical protein
MTFSELYLALRQNVVDGQENPLPTIDSGKFFEVQKYLVLTAHILTPRLVVINDKFWQGIAPADQKIVSDAVAEGIAWNNQEIKSRRALVDKFEGRHRSSHRTSNRSEAGARQRAQDVRGQVGQGLFEKIVELGDHGPIWREPRAAVPRGRRPPADDRVGSVSCCSSHSAGRSAAGRVPLRAERSPGPGTGRVPLHLGLLAGAPVACARPHRHRLRR